MGPILHENWLLKRQLASKVTNSAIDEMYKRAMVDVKNNLEVLKLRRALFYERQSRCLIKWLAPDFFCGAEVI